MIYQFENCWMYCLLRSMTSVMGVFLTESAQNDKGGNHADLAVCASVST